MSSLSCTPDYAAPPPNHPARLTVNNEAHRRQEPTRSMSGNNYARRAKTHSTDQQSISRSITAV
jgi:hypothetical protein